MEDRPSITVESCDGLVQHFVDEGISRLIGLGPTFLHADEALETELVHETQYGFRVVPEALALEERIDAPIAATSFVFVEEGPDRFLHVCVLVIGRQARPPIVIDAPSHIEHLEEPRYRIGRP